MSQLTADQVRAEVQRFWNSFTAKTEEFAQGDFYSPSATVFGSESTRTEPGRLAAARRKREYFDGKTSLNVTLGPIEVIPLGESAAIATYTFRLHANRVQHGLEQSDEDIQHGRGTQVFMLEPDGKILIVHEHLSAVKG